MSTNAAAGSFEAVKETMGVSLAKTESAPFGEHIRDASTVGKIVTAKASDFNKEQQLSTNDVQQVPYQSVGNNKFQQASISI